MTAGAKVAACWSSAVPVVLVGRRLMNGWSSHKIQREFPAIRKRYWGCRPWGRGYFSTTNGAITEDVVLQFLEKHIADPTGISR